MDKARGFVALTRKRLAALIIIIIAACAGMGVLLMRNERASAREKAFEEIASVAEIKAMAVQRWRADRLEHVMNIAGSPLFAKAAGALDGPGASPEVKREIEERLKLAMETFGDRAVFLASAGGEILAGAGGEAVVDETTLREIKEAAEGGKPILGDLFKLGGKDGIVIDALAPVAATSGVLVLVIRCDPSDYLFPFLGRWPVPSSSAETLLAEKSGEDALFLNPLRFDPGAAHSLRLPLGRMTLPAVQAVLGKTGHFKGLDYRGAEVFAELKQVEGSPWSLVAKVDRREVFEGARKEATVELLAIAALALLVMFGAGFIYKARGKEDFKRLYDSERERARAHKAAAEARARFEGFMKSLPGAALIRDMDGRYVYMNETWEKAMGLKREEFVGKTPLECFPKEEAEKLIEGDRRLLAEGWAEAAEMELRCATGRRWWLINRFVIEEEEAGQRYVGLLAIDVTDRKAAEARAAQVTRLYKTLSEVNQALIRTSNRKELLQETCRIIVEHGGFRMAWAGFLDKESGEVVPEGSAGAVDGYLDNLVIRTDGSPESLGPTGCAFREKRPVIFNDCINEPDFAPWREAAIERGYRASCALPVIQRGEVTGLINVYCTRTSAFGEEEARLLEELASDVSYSLTAIEERAERERAQEQLARSQRVQAVISNILRVALAGKSLPEILQDSLNEILSVPWLEPSQKGAVFITEGSRLVLCAQVDMPEALLAKCGSVAPGECLCGRSFSAGEIVFASHLDDQHETTYEGMAPHGHYCVPIVSAGEVKGVLCLYVKEGHEEREEERDTLLAISNALAGIIRRKHAEQELKTSEEKYRAIFEGVAEGIYVSTPEGKPLMANPALVKMLGHENLDEALKRDIEKEGYADPLERRRFKDLIERDGVVVDFEACWRRADGSTINVVENARAVRDSSGKIIAYEGTVRDVTALKNSERALGESEELFRSFFENNPAASYINAASGQLMACNEAFLQLFGFASKDEALKASLADRYARPEERQGFLDELAGEKKIAMRETTYKRVDGSPVHVIETVTGIFNEEGKLNGAVGFLLDVTDKRALEGQLRQAQRMEAVGELAAGIAHDFNNVLMAVQGASELLAKIVAPDMPGYKEVVTIQRASARAALITKQLLGFARKTVLEPVPLDPNDLISGLLPMVQRLLPETIKVEFIEAPEAGFINADKGQMEQVLMNLCVNARDAMPRGGTLTIEIENVLINGSYLETHPWAKPGRYVLISVTDTGTGIKPDVLQKIFDPFFTTKPQGKGTGLGLSMAYGIVKQHDGMLNVYSEPGVGTTFKIYLPMMERRASAVGTKVVKGVAGGHETILVVEDDKEVRNIVVEVLMSIGYKVLYASDGAEALKVLRNSDRIDLVVTDIVMPKMGGKELREATRRMNPSVRFIFTSGYTENVVHHDFILDKGVAFLSKPYGIDVLARKVREILDRREEMRK